MKLYSLPPTLIAGTLIPETLLQEIYNLTFCYLLFATSTLLLLPDRLLLDTMSPTLFCVTLCCLILWYPTSCCLILCCAMLCCIVLPMSWCSGNPVQARAPYWPAQHWTTTRGPPGTPSSSPLTTRSFPRSDWHSFSTALCFNQKSNASLYKLYLN